MYGLVTGLRAVPGRGADLAAEMVSGGFDIPGLISFIVALDAKDADLVWITEVWRDAAAHQASFDLPGGAESFARAEALMAGMEQRVETRVTAGTGLG